MDITASAVDLDPAELIYLVNLAIAYEKFDIEKAVSVVDQFINADGIEKIEYGLEEAFDVYLATGQIESARAVFDRLLVEDPIRAATKSRP